MRSLIHITLTDHNVTTSFEYVLVGTDFALASPKEIEKKLVVHTAKASVLITDVRISVAASTSLLTEVC